MVVSQAGEYAIRALICLARSDGPQTGARLAEATGLPPGYLAKLLGRLRRAGLLAARRGTDARDVFGDRVTVSTVISF